MNSSRAGAESQSLQWPTSCALSDGAGGSKQRIAYLDGLRAIAVTAVVLCHISQIYGVPLPWGYALQEGRHGVDLFFVISGFCLSYPAVRAVFERGSEQFDIARFAAHRIVRIIPPYWLGVLVSIGALAAIGAHLSVTSILNDFLFLDPGRGQHVNGAFWTIPIELRWYVAFPLVLLLWVRTPRAFFVVATLALATALTAARSTDLFILPAFMLGVTAAALSCSRSVNGIYALAASIFLAFTASLPNVEAFWISGDLQNPIWYAAAFCFVVACGDIPLLGRALSSRLVAAIGYISFSIYLVHVPIIVVAHARGVSPWLAAPLSLMLPAIFWAIAERPFFSGAVGRKMRSKLNPRVAAVLSCLDLPCVVYLQARRVTQANTIMRATEQSIVDVSAAVVTRDLL